MNTTLRTLVRANSRHTFSGAVWKTVLLIMFLLSAGQAQAYTVEMSEADLQLMVEQGFPIRQQTPFATTVLSKPKLRIVRGSNRLRLALAISAAFPNNLTSKGRAEIEGELAYDADKGEFHLRHPTVVDLKVEQLPQEYHQMVTNLVGAIARQTLPIIVVYRLDAKDMKQAMTRRILKSVTVKDGKLIAELSL